MEQPEAMNNLQAAASELREHEYNRALKEGITPEQIPNIHLEQSERLLKKDLLNLLTSNKIEV